LEVVLRLGGRAARFQNIRESGQAILQTGFGGPLHLKDQVPVNVVEGEVCRQKPRALRIAAFTAGAKLDLFR
jgi:hypothetical protein